MKDKDYIKDLFQSKLKHIESPVRPELWNGIASSIGSPSTSLLSSFSTSTKVFISLISISSLTILTYLIAFDKPVSSQNKNVLVSNGLDQNLEKKDLLNVDTLQIVRLPVSNKYFVSTTIIDSSVLYVQSAEHSMLSVPLLKPLDTALLVLSSSVFTNHDLSPKIDNQAIVNPLDNTSESIIEDNNVTIDAVFPNVFTPNGDGSNDFFKIPLLSLTDFSIVIINSNNETVFQSTDVNFEWDGRLRNGDLAPTGKYIYYIVGNQSNNKYFNKFNQLNLVY